MRGLFARSCRFSRRGICSVICQSCIFHRRSELADVLADNWKTKSRPTATLLTLSVVYRRSVVAMSYTGRVSDINYCAVTSPDAITAEAAAGL